MTSARPTVCSFVLVMTVLVCAPPLDAQAPRASPFQGGVPSGEATADTLSLSIGDAIARALEHNLAAILADGGVDRARGSQTRARADLLPTLDGRIVETRQQINLKAFGFPLPAGVPSLVGPFNVFDARVYFSQSLYDAAAMSDLRAERHNLAAAEHAERSARDVVVLVAADAYLQALATSARADAARAQVETAEAIHAQALTLKASGLAAGIDVLRAEVQRSTERQRATAARNDFEKSKLQLARLIGLPIGQPFRLSDALPPVSGTLPSLSEALEHAYKTRPDYLAALEHVRAAEASRQAVADERRPSVSVRADIGDIGLGPGDARGTYSLAGSVRVPIFQPDTPGKLTEADADLRRARAEADDLRASIYYDIRTAFLDLDATREQLEVAVSTQALANQQLAQARDRFAAGVANNIEVVQAQEAVAHATDAHIAALYGFNEAEGRLVLGMGDAEAALGQIFRR